MTKLLIGLGLVLAVGLYICGMIHIMAELPMHVPFTMYPML